GTSMASTRITERMRRFSMVTLLQSYSNIIPILPLCPEESKMIDFARISSYHGGRIEKDVKNTHAEKGFGAARFVGLRALVARADHRSAFRGRAPVCAAADRGVFHAHGDPELGDDRPDRRHAGHDRAV